MLFDFSLILVSPQGLNDQQIQEISNKLYSAGCDDSLFGYRGAHGEKKGYLFLDFCREAPTAMEAVASAILDFERAATGLKLIEIRFWEEVIYPDANVGVSHLR